MPRKTAESMEIVVCKASDAPARRMVRRSPTKHPVWSKVKALKPGQAMVIPNGMLKYTAIHSTVCRLRKTRPGLYTYTAENGDIVVGLGRAT